MIVLKALAYRRIVTEEIMDRPDVDPADHREALEGLRRINRASHVHEQMMRPIVELACAQKLNRISLIDVACGGGDVPINLATALGQLGIAVDLTLLDRSPTAIAQALQSARQAGVVCRGIEADALGQMPAQEKFDVVTNSLFLHHVPAPEQVVELLARMRDRAARMVIISDLRRSRFGYAVAWAGCRILSRSRIVHHDGPVSVRAAWTSDELSQFAANAGMKEARIYHCWPRRMLLVWQRN